MKKLFSFLLALALLAGLCVPALASAEADDLPAPAAEAAEELAEEPAEAPAEEPAEEPVEESAEAPVDEPADEPAEEPAAEPVEAPDQDGASSVSVSYSPQKISGKVYTSALSDTFPLQLTGTTILVVDMDKSVNYIKGDYTLAIELTNGRQLTVNNDDGHGISVGSLSVSGDGTLKVVASKDALNVDMNVVITSGVVELYPSGDGIFSRNDNVEIHGGTVRIICGEDAIDAKKDVIIKPGAFYFGDGENGIYSREGDISLAGKVTSYAEHSAVRADAGSITSAAELTVKTTDTAESSKNYCIYADQLINLRGDVGSSVKMDAARCGMNADNGNLVVYCDVEASAGYDAALRADKGNIVLFSGDITAYGNVNGVGPYDRYAGVSGKQVIVQPNATLDASGDYYGIFGSDLVKINGATVARANGTNKSNYGFNAYSGVYGANQVLVSGSLQAWSIRSAITTGTTGTITIGEGCDIISPEGAHVGSVTEGYSSTNCIVTSSGKMADSVTIKAIVALTRVEFSSLTWQLTAGQPVKADGVLKTGQHCSLVEQKWCEAGRNEPYTGTAVSGRSYYYTAVFEPDPGYIFDSSLLPVYLNGYYLGDGVVDVVDNVLIFTRDDTPYAEDISITAAEITVTAPAAGAQIKADGRVASGSHFTISEEYWCSQQKSSTKLTSGTFENGKTYFYYARLIPDMGYAFAGQPASYPGSDTLSVKVNGKEANERYRYANGEVQVLVAFKAAGPTYTGSIVLGMIPEPAAGGLVSASKAVAASTDYTVTAQGWYDDLATETADTTFQANKTYIWMAQVQLQKDGVLFPDDYQGELIFNGETITAMSAGEVADAVANDEPIRLYTVSSNLMTIIFTFMPAGEPSVKLNDDATYAYATNYDGLYARVALVIDINGVSGLFVSQPTINDDGTIVIPSITMPGLTVKGVSVALVPTIADIQKSTPDVKASDMKML